MEELPLIDSQRLNRTRRVLGDVAMHRLTALFIGELERRLEDLLVAANSRDIAQLHHHAHALQGASANYGAPRLHAIALKIESSNTPRPSWLAALAATVYATQEEVVRARPVAETEG